MIYAAAVLAVIYLSIKLAPYFVAAFLSICMAMENAVTDEVLYCRKQNQEVIEYILNNYSNYRDFKKRYKDFKSLSWSAKRAMNRVFSY